MSNNNRNDSNEMALLDALAYEIAVHEAEHGKSSADSERWAREVDVVVRARLAEMGRRLTPQNVKIRRMKPISASLATLGRDVLVSMIEQLRSAGSLRYAHRELSGLTDDDLRRLIELHGTLPKELE